MVCLDGSDNSKAAFYTTIAFMKKQQPTLNTENKDHLYLLNVVDDVRVSNTTDDLTQIMHMYIYTILVLLEVLVN